MNRIKLKITKYQKSCHKKIFEYLHLSAIIHKAVNKHLIIHRLRRMTISMFQIKEKLVIYHKFH